MTEEWIELPIGEESHDTFLISNFKQNLDGTLVELEGENHKLQIWFNYADSVRINDESNRLETYDYLEWIKKVQAVTSIRYI